MTRPMSEERESLTALLRRTKQTLCVPAAEYVPAMGDAMLLLDRAIQMSYQTDPRWLSTSSAERGMREALERIVALDHHNHGPVSRASEIARAALSPKGEGK